MSVVPMKRISVVAMKRDRKAVLEYLQVQGAVQISVKGKEDDVFTKTDMSKQKQVFQKNTDRAEEALAILKRHVPEKAGLLAGFEGRKELTTSEFQERQEKIDATMRVCSRIIDLDKKLSDSISNIPKLEDQKKALEPWMNFDLPLDYAGTRTTAVFTGCLQGEYTREALYTELKKLSGVDTFECDIISAQSNQTCIFLVCEKKDQAAVREALRRMNFASPPLSGLNPSERIKQIGEEIAREEKKQEEIRKDLETLSSHREDIRFASDYFTLRAEKYGVISELLQSRRVFYLEGYVPENMAEPLAKELESRFDAAAEVSDLKNKEKPPVLLKNNAFAVPLEGITESYSLPGKKEIDPTFISACFYYILFGIMLSDAGYGLLLVIGTGFILWKFGKTMEAGMKKFMKMFLLCGISTTFWGVMFGSFFGDAIKVIGTTFLGKGENFGPKPLWFEPLSEPMRMLTFCFILALIHMFVGLGAKAYMLLKQGKVMDMIYDVVLWYVLLIACVVYLLTVPTMADMLGVNTLSASLQKPAGILMIIAAVGIILTGGRESKNWFKRILKGLYSLYGISGWLSDILSYSRLLALGLATGVIATVFNSMGSMGGKTPVGVVLFIIVFLVGNVLNLAINALGAYVHTNRLTYVEFFGKFYEGGGSPFRPFAVNTKYYKIKEDM